MPRRVLAVIDIQIDDFERMYYSQFKLNGIILHVVASYKYIGHYITDDLSDNDDIYQ